MDVVVHRLDEVAQFLLAADVAVPARHLVPKELDRIVRPFYAVFCFPVSGRVVLLFDVAVVEVVCALRERGLEDEVRKCHEAPRHFVDVIALIAIAHLDRTREPIVVGVALRRDLDDDGVLDVLVFVALLEAALLPERQEARRCRELLRVLEALDSEDVGAGSLDADIRNLEGLGLEIPDDQARSRSSRVYNSP